ncbi:MAG: hypothetical protein ACE5H9_02025 [Anaerolineae bacterium]
MRPLANRLIALLLAIIFILTGSISPAQAQGPEPFANCRLGVGGAYNPDLTQFNSTQLNQLNLGLYLDWNARNALPSGLPAGVQYIQTIRVHQLKDCGKFCIGNYLDPPAYTVSPSLSTIASHAAAMPGSLWRIGNEIERRDWDGGGQDEMTPELYATAFHEIREVIKAADPTARIAIGSVIQATPLRLEYLDRVWDSYFSQYGYPMGQDIDVWIVHGFILREVSNSWGAEIPAGLNDAGGLLYGADGPEIAAAHTNIALFQQFTEAMRDWMAAKGERNKPLINTEYGILYKQVWWQGNGSWIPIDSQTVRDYLTASFDYLLTASDPQTGFPADENRLVQGWVWYSLNDDIFNGALFDQTTNQYSSYGTTWQGYVSDPAHPLASQPSQNLLAANLRVEDGPAFVLPGDSITLTLKADIANSGNSPTNTNNNLQASFWDGDPDDPNSNQIGSAQTLNDLPGCGRFTTVEVQWPNRSAGNHTWFVKVEPIAGETNTADNIATHTLATAASVPQADLQVIKSVDDSAPLPGSTISYTLRITNTGPDRLNGVVVTDTLPAGLTFDTYSSSQGIYYSLGRWEVGSLETDQAASLTIAARVNQDQAGQTIVNQASISSSYPYTETQGGNNTETASLVVGHKLVLPLILK